MIYFDNAATSLPKPAAVLKAANRAAGLGNPGRGGHLLAMEASRLLYGTRAHLALHFGAPSPESVCFFSGATEALNRVIKSIVPVGGRVLLSDMEHNAVRRPALALKKKGVTIDYFHGYGTKEEILSSFTQRLEERPDLAVFLHTSNICPQTLPVGELCALCREKGVLSLVDCAQAGGHLPLSLKDLQADGMVLPGHKGLLGLQGVGVLLCSERLKEALEQVETLVEGGSGSFSLEEGMPTLLPERLEAGTLPLPAIAALSAGVAYIEQRGYEEIGERISLLSARLLEGVSVVEGVIPCAKRAQGRGPCLFDTVLEDNARLAERLSEEGVLVREGLHCAPLAHKTVGSVQRGGIRVSFSMFNTPKQVDAFLCILQRELRALR